MKKLFTVSGQTSIITKNYVAYFWNSARSLLFEENENCKYPSYPKNSDERDGCAQIQKFVRSLCGGTIYQASMFKRGLVHSCVSDNLRNA